nr:vomeronasal type-1 receptor 4-like [Manis javanica]
MTTTFGIRGNCSLLYHYFFLYFTRCRLRSTYLIIKNLLVANSLVLFSCGVQCTVRSFGWFHALDSVFTAPRSFPDIVCLGLMLGASSCTVSILHRHKPRVQHIRTANVALRSSPESRATRSILLLVSTLVCFYTLSAILQSFLSVTENPCWFLLDTNTVYFRFLAPPPGLGERNLVPWTNGKREVGGSSLVRTNETRVLSEERGQ